jgi:hypothetical protein
MSAKNGNRKCDCKHYYAIHRMGERGYGQCLAPGCRCEGVHHKAKKETICPKTTTST